MEFLRRALNPWGEDVPIGVSWDLIWAAVIIGAIFVVGHALMVPKKVAAGEIDENEAKGLPEKLQRHTPGARVFHWSMSVAMFVLLITAFFPLVGIRFAWVTIHWIAGVALILTVIYHIYHVFANQDFWAMWIDRRDIAEGKQGLEAALGRSGARRPRSGKYPIDQKMFHHAAMVVTFGAVRHGRPHDVQGRQLPVGAEHVHVQRRRVGVWVYVIHGVSGIGLIFLVMAHVYFAIRPEKRWMTWSMINGWIDRDRYLENHDPGRWVVTEQGSAAELEASGSGGGTGQAAVSDKVRGEGP